MKKDKKEVRPKRKGKQSNGIYEESSDEDDDNTGEEQEMSVEELAALDIQRVFRGHVRRKRLRFDQRREQLQGGAATLITKVSRGHLARKRVARAPRPRVPRPTHPPPPPLRQADPHLVL